MNPLTLKTLWLTNYRCFQNLTLDFHERLTVLVAQNGGGKTSILDAIAVAFGPFVGAFDEASGSHFEAGDIRQSLVRQTESREMEYAKGGVMLEAEGHFPFACFKVFGLDMLPVESTWKRQLSAPKKTKTTIKDCKELISYGKYLQDEVRTVGNNIMLPLVAYYGTGRLWQQKKLMTDDLSRSSRTIGYANCLDPGSSYKSFATWFRYWTENAVNARLEIFQAKGIPTVTEFDTYIESVNTAIHTCLHISGWDRLDYSIRDKELVAIHREHGRLPISMLSDGIRNMIGLVGDIAFRATKLNPHLGAEAARQTPGIVLIDEVDMHLHPEWQQTVLTGLQEAFPQVQFIVTTHSPQVLTTVHSASIRVLKWADGQPVVETPLHEVYAEESRTALEDVLGVPSRPPLEINRQLADYLRRIEAGEDTQATIAIRAELEQKLGAGHPELQLADMLLMRNAARRAQVKQ
jgi:predicted ATP-binding protein involved in virulence